MSADAITPRAIRIALRQLSSDRTPADGPLTDLALVTRTLERRGSPAGRSSRQWALGHVLCETVEAELARLRGAAGSSGAAIGRARGGASPGERFDLARTAPAAAMADALDRLRQDFRGDDPALEGCSTVYHLYLRPDLGLSTARVAALVAGRHPRTVQRRLGLGLDLIAHRLRILEAAAAAERQLELLQRRLPAPAGGQLFGAEPITALLRTWWADAGRPAVLVLSGPGGSGKSTTAAAFVRGLLDGDPSARAVWLRSCDRRPRPTPAGARTVDRLRAMPALREDAPAGPWSTAVTLPDRRDLPPDRPAAQIDGVGRSVTSARALMTAGRALGPHAGSLVVVDGVDDPREMWTVARAVGRMTGRTVGRTGAWPRVLITSRLGWGAFPAAEITAMPALDPGAALAMLRHECRRRALHGAAAASDRALGALVAAAAGHPGALLLAADELRWAPIDAVAERLRAGAGRAGDLFERMWTSAWHCAPPPVRQVVDGVAALERAARAADPAAIASTVDMTGDEVEAALGAAHDLGLLMAGVGGGGGFWTPAFLAVWRGGADG